MNCACGCGRPAGRTGRFAHGHGRRGRTGWYVNPSPSPRLSRERASRKLRERPCELAADGTCSRTLDTHHRNGDPLDNRDENLARLCRSHHLRIHRGHKFEIEQKGAAK